MKSIDNKIFMQRVVSAKYDAAIDYHVSMYDLIPYKRNSDVCGRQQVAMYSGHIIKYYMCVNDQEQFKIDNKDDEIENILAKIEQNQRINISPSDVETISDNKSDGITQEQIQTLLDDPEEVSPDDNNDIDAAATPVNAFDGIDDW